MKISKLFLADYIRLRVSRIREIELDVSNGSTQLIIGSNGSGKSSVIHELFPYPPVKSSFGKTGSKTIHLHHDSSFYNLTYDPQIGHAFFKDNENLNISGTNEIQRELIFEHFGLTNEIHTLLKCSLPICDMVPSQRKKVLMGMNPVDISVFIEKYQKVHKDVVSYSNNLDRLYERQKQLMTQKLPDDQYRSMLERKDILENQEKLLLIWMTRVSSELELYPEVNRNVDIPNDTYVRIRKLFQTLPKFDTISRVKSDSILVEYQTRSNMLSNELRELEATLGETITTLNEYESKKKLLATDDCNTEKEFSDISERINAFKFEDNFKPINECDFASVMKISDVIRDILVELSYIEYQQIHTKDDLNVLYRKMISVKSELDNVTSSLSQLRKQYDELKKSMKEYRIGTPCDKAGCELLHMYTKHTTTKHADLNKLDETIKTSQTKYEQLLVDYNTATDNYNIQVKIWEYIHRVQYIVNSNTSLAHTFSNEYILKRIQESVMLFVNDISRHITKSEQFIEYVKLKKRLNELEVINSSLASKKQLSYEILSTEIISQSNRLENLRNKHNDKTQTIKILDSRCELIRSFVDTKTEAHKLHNSVEQLLHDSSIQASRTYLLKLYDALRNVLNRTRSELVDITNISKEQDQIIVRLDTEVNAVINELKPVYDNAKLIEKSLYDLPIKYTRTFINNIIEITNYFVNEIMTYPIHLIPIPEGEICDFNFPIIVENEIPMKDISVCSDGQKAIIQLAFNLAMVIELNFDKYPIYVDEMDRALDTTHSRRLTDMLLNLIDQRVIEQLFIIGHHASMLDRLVDSGNITVLNGDNIILPAKYNEHAKIVYY